MIMSLLQLASAAAVAQYVSVSVPAKSADGVSGFVSPAQQLH